MTGVPNGAFGYTAFANRYPQYDPRLGMLAVAERIMLRGNRYVAAGLAGSVAAVGAALHGCDTPVVRVTGRRRSRSAWVQPRGRGAQDR